LIFGLFFPDLSMNCLRGEIVCYVLLTNLVSTTFWVWINLSKLLIILVYSFLNKKSHEVLL